MQAQDRPEPVLARPGSPSRWPFALTGVAVAIAAFAGLYAANPHLPIFNVYLFASGLRPVAVQHDTGYGFNASQRSEIGMIPGSFVTTLSEPVAPGPVTLAFTFDGNVPNAVRPATSGTAWHELSPGAGPVVLRHPVAADMNEVVVEIRDVRGLKRVTVEGPRETETVHVATTLANGWGPTPGGVLFDRSGPAARIGVSRTLWNMQPVPCRGLRVDGVPVAGEGPPLALAAMTGNEAGAALVRLAAEPGSAGWASATGIDMAPVALYRHPVKNAVQAMLAVSLGLAAGWLGWVTARAVRREGVAATARRFVRRRGVFLGSFAVFAAYYGVWAAGLWPGIVMSDSLAPVSQARGLQFDVWFSYVYSLLALAVMQFGGAYTNLIVFQVGVMAGVAAGVLAYLVRVRCPWWLTIPIAVFFLSPTVATYAAFYQRGALNGILTTAVLAVLFRTLHRLHYRDGQKIPSAELALLFSLLLASALLRKDNLALAAVAGLFVVAFAAGQRFRVGATGAVAVAAFVAFSGPVERAVVKESGVRNRLYQLTALMNPVGALVARGYHTDSPDEDARVIDRIVPREVLKKEWSPYNDNVYWTHCATRQYTQEDIDALRKWLFRAALRNPGIVVGARCETFLSNLTGPGHMSLPPADPAGVPAGLQQGFRDFGIWPGEATDSPLTNRVHRLTAQLTSSQRSLSRLWNTAPQFLVVVVVALLYRWLPVSSAVAVALIARLGVVFAGEPGCYFHYLYDLHLFGAVLPALCAIEWRARRNSARHL